MVTSRVANGERVSGPANVNIWPQLLFFLFAVILGDALWLKKKEWQRNVVLQDGENPLSSYVRASIHYILSKRDRRVTDLLTDLNGEFTGFTS